jgi:hypothetical protein
MAGETAFDAVIVGAGFFRPLHAARLRQQG